MSAAITAITMPKWGLTMTEGTVVAWLKSQGSSFAEGEELLRSLHAAAWPESRPATAGHNHRMEHGVVFLLFSFVVTRFSVIFGEPRP